MRLILVFILLLLPVFATAQDNQIKFRGYDWGTSKSVILKEKGEPYYKSYNNIFYKKTIANSYLGSTVMYIFYKDQLASGGINIDMESYGNIKITVYKDILHLITKKYGEPTYIDTIGTTVEFKNKPEYKSYGVNKGLEKFVLWESEQSRIELRLGSLQGIYALQAVYYSKNLYPKFKKEFDDKIDSDRISDFE